jgi:hypothetical protein
VQFGPHCRFSQVKTHTLAGMHIDVEGISNGKSACSQLLLLGGRSAESHRLGTGREKRYGRAVYDADLNANRKVLAGLREKGMRDYRLAYGGAYPSIRERRAIQYSKGALFMDHLRSVLGEDAFWPSSTATHVNTLAVRSQASISSDLWRKPQAATSRPNLQSGSLDRQTLPLLASHIHKHYMRAVTSREDFRWEKLPSALRP